MSIKKERLWSPKGKGYTKNSIINCFLINGKKKEGEREGHAWNIRVVSGSPILLWIWMFCSVLWALNFTTLLARGLRNVCFGTNHLCFSVLTVTRIMDHYYIRVFLWMVLLWKRNALLLLVRSKECCMLLKRCTWVRQFRMGKTKSEKERKQNPQVSSLSAKFMTDEWRGKWQQINQILTLIIVLFRVMFM